VGRAFACRNRKFDRRRGSEKGAVLCCRTPYRLAVMTVEFALRRGEIIAVRSGYLGYLQHLSVAIDWRVRFVWPDGSTLRRALECGYQARQSTTWQSVL
jgi:hypothetical protein